MSAGMQMMMKSFGIDPEEIRQNIETFKNQVTTSVESVDLRLAKVEAQTERTLFLVEQIYNACLAEVSGPQKLLSNSKEGESSSLHQTV